MDTSPTVYLCPACRKPAAKDDILNYSVQSITTFSDGVKIENRSTFSSHYTPNLTKCPFCAEIFFLNNAEPVKRNIFLKKYKLLDKPNENDYINTVKQGLAKTPDEEIEARSCLWYALNDKIRFSRKQYQRDPDDEKTFFQDEKAALWEENCNALLSLLEKKAANCKIEKDKDELTITIAELNRNLGNFDVCFDILETLPDTYEWLKSKYTPRTASHDRLVFILISPEEKQDDFAAEAVDLDDPDKAIEYYSKEIETRNCSLGPYYAFRAEAYLKKGELQTALDDINTALCESGGGEENYCIRAQIYEKMGDAEKVNWNIFKAKHAQIYQYTVNEHSRRNPRPKREGADDKPVIITEKVNLKKSGGKIILDIAAQEGEPVEPEILYSGGENALFRRKPEQFILLKKVPEEFFSDTDVRESIFNKKEILISEIASNPPMEYTAKVRLVIETLESAESIVKDGYPLYTSLRARVSANMDKAIADVIGKEDFINLAAVLAREENYALFNKYLEEKLPLNERVSVVFGTWQPTPLYYVTTKRLVGFMEDPLKIIRFLAASGADPNMSCKDSDTPLGNQCLDGGLSIIMKTLLESGADPNCFTHIESGLIKPLHLTLLPSEYDKETKEFTPIKAKEIEKTRLLIDAGADVNYVSELGSTALSLAINNAQGEVQKKLVKMLLDKGADEQSAIDALKEAVEHESHSAAYSLYEIYSGQIDGLNIKPDSKLARKYLLLAADFKYKSDNEDDGYDDGRHDAEI
ncbi:MAG: hypothetical protein FWB77_00190 [Treponema sp.]|nr:hypothetical protein [Treponema sp.]